MGLLAAGGSAGVSGGLGAWERLRGLPRPRLRALCLPPPLRAPPAAACGCGGAAGASGGWFWGGGQCLGLPSSWCGRGGAAADGETGYREDERQGQGGRPISEAPTTDAPSGRARVSATGRPFTFWTRSNPVTAGEWGTGSRRCRRG